MVQQQTEKVVPVRLALHRTPPVRSAEALTSARRRTVTVPGFADRAGTPALRNVWSRYQSWGAVSRMPIHASETVVWMT